MAKEELIKRYMLGLIYFQIRFVDKNNNERVIYKKNNGDYGTGRGDEEMEVRFIKEIKSSQENRNSVLIMILQPDGRLIA
ncbi:MAG: hypothetical protein IPJ01_11765 [Micavibrio sp.]|nr:hypothetical protein [Micavibrio sp.]